MIVYPVAASWKEPCRAAWRISRNATVPPESDVGERSPVTPCSSSSIQVCCHCHKQDNPRSCGAEYRRFPGELTAGREGSHEASWATDHRHWDFSVLSFSGGIRDIGCCSRQRAFSAHLGANRQAGGRWAGEPHLDVGSRGVHRRDSGALSGVAQRQALGAVFR